MCFTYEKNEGQKYHMDMCKGDRQNARSATELSDCVHPAIEVTLWKPEKKEREAR